MKRFVLAIGLLALAAPLTLAQTSTPVTIWTGDPARSAVDFSIKHLTVSTVHGRMGKMEATILLDTADITRSAVSATIDIGAVDTGEQMRDSIIKSADFLDVDKFPTATFASTGVVKSGSNLTVNGNLTLHGVTRPVALSVTGPSEPVAGMDHKPRAGYTATATINRADFGIGKAFPDSIVGDEVKLTIELEAVKQ